MEAVLVKVNSQILAESTLISTTTPPAIMQLTKQADWGGVERGRGGLLVLVLPFKTARGQVKQTALFIGQLHS